MRKAIPLFALFILLFSSFIGEPNVTYGSTAKLKQLEKDRKQVESKLSEKEKAIINTLDEIEKLHNEINKIEKELAKHDDHIATTEKEILKYEEEFEQLVTEINELNTLIESRTDILSKQLAAYQENGGDISYLEVIFNAKSFLDFISRVTSVSTITGAERQIIEQQIKDKEEIEQIQQTIVDKIDEQEQLINELEEEKTYINEKQAMLKKSEKELKQKEKQLKQDKNKLTQENSELKQLENSYRNRIKAKQSNKQTTNVEKSSNSEKQSSKKQPNDNVNIEANVGKTFTVQATAYTPYCKGCSGITSTGINVNNDRHQRIIAVDPSVIPLGSRVWVEGYGEAIAADRGSAIKGNRIDVLYKSQNAALQWGRRTVTVKILN